LTVRTPGAADVPPGRRGKIHLIKSAVTTLLVLSAAIGVLLAALVIGSVLAVVILIAVLLVVGVWLISRLWHRGATRN
jgi:hypothetical protein